MKKMTMLLSITALLLFSCCKKDENGGSEENYLSFNIDGVLWEADTDIFGSYHFSEEIGPKLINIAGSKGEGSAQQAFNINLYNTDKEGSYTVNIPDNTSAGANQNVAQLGNLTPTNYLCGGLMQGSQFTVNITKVSKDPQIVEATFSGKMQCVEGNTITITDGKFSYHE
ncbi:MAG: hypothetical protein K1X55_06830 [Chitinophagales bacterium]|nr:hypothetical protein [Chitinophagales bacterium]MBX7225726.1 hypothetical protein [Chitinophagales bacterium]